MELAKKFLFKLDSKSVKVLREKSFMCYDTDTIKLVIEIFENDDYKDLYNSNIEVIFSYPNGESNPIKQTMEDGGIVIEDDSLISVVPKSGCLMPTDYLRIDINIYDEDEFITLQPFVFKVYKSKESEIFEEAQDVIKTMISINEQVTALKENVDTLTSKIEETSANIDNQLEVTIREVNNKMNEAKNEINNSISNLNNSVAEVIGSANTRISDAIINGENRIEDLINVSNVKIQTFLDNSNTEVNNLLERIENTDIELDEVFLKSTSLLPIDNGGRILFTSEILLTSPTNLINKSYILTTSGSPYVSSVITSNLGFLYFTLEGDNIVINYSTIANKSVQGNSISIVPQFNNLSNSISKDSSGYKIYILTNLLTSYVDNATCTITSNTSLSNNI